MSELYPLSLQLLGRNVLVVGGGSVAARRAKSLLEAGAFVTVVAPELGAELTALHEVGVLNWKARAYRGGDLDYAWLVHTATGDSAVDAQVNADADDARIWCINAADKDRASAWKPAVLTTGNVTVAVNAGGDPRLAIEIKNAISLAFDTGQLPFKHHRANEAIAQSGAASGSVALVGGGPGSEGLITVRGRTLLARADVVVADRLGPRGLLDTLRSDTTIIEVGKSPNHHPVPQEQINQILVREALAGRRVVRLKGGDPFVLGRGGEEMEHCRRYGIDVEVVPGVTSAISVPAAAGIPVTHRGVSRGFSVISAHEDLGDLPPGRDHTVVLLMGVATLAKAAVTLSTGGRGDLCPVAIIESGFSKAQRVTIGTLGTIAHQAKTLGVRSPAVIVVGDVVRLSPYAVVALGESLETNEPIEQPDVAQTAHLRRSHP